MLFKHATRDQGREPSVRILRILLLICVGIGRRTELLQERFNILDCSNSIKILY